MSLEKNQFYKNVRMKMNICEEDESKEAGELGNTIEITADIYSSAKRKNETYSGDSYLKEVKIIFAENKAAEAMTKFVEMSKMSKGSYGNTEYYLG